MRPSMGDEGIDNFQAPEPLVEVWRGMLIESRHRGHLVAVDQAGSIVASLGSPEVVTYLRSSAKPFQCIPLISSGAADRFGFTDKEIALACASHNGEPIHTETAAEMLRKIGLDQSALKCGVHEPFSSEVVRSLRENGEQPNVLQNNCSGKHAGMLALALQVGAPVETYDSPHNPVQQMIARVISEFSDVPESQIVIGIDGCGTPVFGVSIFAMALMYARLVHPPDSLDEEKREACRRIVSAMNTYPEMIGGGLTERLDTEIMRAAHGRLVSKVGAEGVYTAGILPCKEWPNGLGLAFKIEDGEDRRARPTVVVESLRQLGVLIGDGYKSVSHFASFPVRNHRGDTVGEIRPSFELGIGS
jgi:L-asparaginase II